MRVKFASVGFLALALSALSPLAPTGFGGAVQVQAAANGVVIQGSQRVDRETILSYLQFGPSDTLTAENIDASIKALFQTGLFSDVKISRKGRNVIIKVVENPMINTVNFENNAEIDDSTLKKEVSARQSLIYTKARVQSDTRRILDLYQAKGFYNVSVVPKLIPLGGNRVNLAFEINENGKTQIEDITFIGNDTVSSDRLRSAMLTKQKTWWNPFGNKTTYNPDQLEYDKELIRRFYLKSGYADVQVTDAQANLRPDGKSFAVTITVIEGPRYDIGDVAVNVGSSKLDGDALRRKVKTGVGDTYDSVKVDRSAEALTIESSKQGMAFVKVDPKVDRNADGKTVNLTYNITQGARAYVERIDIIGNSRTRDEVVRRELKLFEGDAYNQSLIERARRRLTALDYFETVEFREEPGSSPDKVVLVVELKEKATGSLSFSLGYSSTETVVGTVEYAERNLFGMGYQQNLALSASFLKQSVNYSFTDPYFLGSDISAGIDLFANNADNQNASGYNSMQYGGALRSGFRLDDYQSVNFKLMSQYRYLTGVNTLTAAPAVIAEQGATWKNSFGAGYVYDDLDNPMLPTSGLRAQLNAEVAGLVGDAQFAKIEGKAWYFIPLFEDKVVVKLQANAGHIQELGKSVSLQDRFFKGADSFRGFASSGVGPMQIGNNGLNQSIGAMDYAIGTIEANFPLGLPESFGISGAVFTDFGTVFNGGTLITAGCTHASGCTVSDAPDLRLSVGAGIVWQSPFGPLRLDWSYPILKSATDNVQYWRFSVGTRF